MTLFFHSGSIRRNVRLFPEPTGGQFAGIGDQFGPEYTTNNGLFKKLSK
jgi:hypothetical protein